MRDIDTSIINIFDVQCKHVEFHIDLGKYTLILLPAFSI